MTPRRRLGPAAIALVITVSPLALSRPAAAQAALAQAAASVSPTWSTYFYPARVGRTCHESFTTATASGEETLSVAAVKSSPQGRRITVNVSGSSQSGGKNQPINSSLQYTLTPHGGLVNEATSTLVVGVGAHTNGTTVLPTVKALLAGGSSLSTIRESVPLPASQLAQISPVLKPNQTGINVSVSLREKGRAVSTLTVPMGTFHHLLEIQTTIHRIQVTNAIPSAGSEIAAAIRPTLSQVLSFSTWYAPKIGPVQVSLGGVTIAATSCSG